MDALRAKLRDVVGREMAQDPAHDLAHLDRVWLNAQRIAAGEGYGPQETLLAACYLHDLVNVAKDSPLRSQASRLSAEKADPFLIELGFHAADRQSIKHAIEAHSYTAGIVPETENARILRDSDRLEAVGAIGIARTFMVAGALQLNLINADDPFAVSRNLDDTRWSLDHWQVKLLHLHEGMLTETGRALAKQRQATMLAYLSELAAELGAELPDHLRDRQI